MKDGIIERTKFFYTHFLAVPWLYELLSQVRYVISFTYSWESQSVQE